MHPRIAGPLKEQGANRLSSHLLCARAQTSLSSMRTTSKVRGGRFVTTRDSFAKLTKLNCGGTTISSARYSSKFVCLIRLATRRKPRWLRRSAWLSLSSSTNLTPTASPKLMCATCTGPTHRPQLRRSECTRSMPPRACWFQHVGRCRRRSLRNKQNARN